MTTKKMKIVISEKINLNALERLCKASHLNGSQITCEQNDCKRPDKSHKNVYNDSEIASQATLSSQ